MPKMLAQQPARRLSPRQMGDHLPAAPTAGGPAPTTGGAAPTAPLGAVVDQAAALLSSVVDRLEPGRVSGPDALRLYGCLAAVERLATAGKTLLAPRIEESGVWRDGGHPSSAALLAAIEGVPTGQARRTLEVGRQLQQLPGTEDALRSGRLSGPKVAELAGAATLDPSKEQELLDGAAEQPLHAVKERCQRARASAAQRDQVAATRRIRAARHFSSWTDADGAFCYQGRDTADRGAQILRALSQVAHGLRSAGVRADDEGAEAPGHLPERAVRADAFFLLMTRGTSGPCVGPPHEVPPSIGPGSDDLVSRPPSCQIMVRVDLDALLRGSTAPGEICEIDGQGPIPVPMARDMANDAFLTYVFHQAGDIRSISHFGRTINRRLRTALVHRDRTCVVPGCDVAWGLEIDHVIPFAEGGPTTLDNLALLCHHHHFLKTFEGWTLERSDSSSGAPGWRFEPLPAFGQEPGLGTGSPGP